MLVVQTVDGLPGPIMAACIRFDLTALRTVPLYLSIATTGAYCEAIATMTKSPSSCLQYERDIWRDSVYLVELVGLFITLFLFSPPPVHWCGAIWRRNAEVIESVSLRESVSPQTAVIRSWQNAKCRAWHALLN